MEEKKRDPIFTIHYCRHLGWKYYFYHLASKQHTGCCSWSSLLFTKTRKLSSNVEIMSIEEGKAQNSSERIGAKTVQ